MGLELLIAAVLYWPQHNEIIPDCEKWIIVRGRLFKAPCDLKEAPRYYWLCDVQKFIDHMGHKHDHVICSVVDHDEVIKSA